MPPAAGVMQNALAALDSPTDSSQYNEQFKPTTHDGKEIAILQEVSTEIADDSDLLSVENATEVRITDGYFSDELLGELFEEESDSSQAVESNEEAVPQAEQAEIPQGGHPEQAAPIEQAESTTEEVEETEMAEQAEIPQGEQTEQSESTGDEQEMPVDVEWQEGQISENDEWSVGW